jgi:hypothetical protein
MYNFKRLLGELFGAVIAVVWILFAFLGTGSLVFLAVAISLTILFGVLASGLIRSSSMGGDYKRLLGELFGAGIAVVWIYFALIAPSDILFLVVAISLTILFGVLAGGLIKLGK